MPMRMWEPGDPIEGGNDTGIPDVKYFDYLKDKSEDNDYRYSDSNYNDYCLNDLDYAEEHHKKRNLSFNEILEMANVSFDIGNFGEALNYYDQALNMHYSEEAKSRKAECLHKLGRNGEASQLYFELGDRYTWGNDDKNIAVKYYKKSLECNPNNEDSLDKLGYVLKELKRYDDALTYYGRIKYKNVDWAMAFCYMKLKKYQKALLLLDRIVRDNPYRDDFLDQKCECLIGLSRRNEAIGQWERFIDFLMENECYQRALDRLDLLSKSIKNDDNFINGRREKCLKEKKSLEIRFRAILKVMTNYHMYNPNGLDENDLYGFIKFVCDESGESVDDIVRWYNAPMLDSSSFKAICGGYLHYTHWEKIVKMYEQGRFRDL